MQVPLHPIVVHFPIALAFLLPLLSILFAFFIKTQKMKGSMWLIIVGLHIFTVGAGYLALETGEREEDRVAKVVDKDLISDHEKYAEIFVGVTVVATVISVVAFFLQTNIQFYAQLANVLVLLVAAFFAYETGEHGGDLVYKHGATRAYELNLSGDVQMTILPTPGQNTSESEFPVQDPEENESLKVDDNDYGNDNGDTDEDVEKLED
jgi:uncharacterized membrane protein